MNKLTEDDNLIIQGIVMGIITRAALHEEVRESDQRYIVTVVKLLYPTISLEELNYNYEKGAAQLATAFKDEKNLLERWHFKA